MRVRNQQTEQMKVFWWVLTQTATYKIPTHLFKNLQRLNRQSYFIPNVPLTDSKSIELIFKNIAFVVHLKETI